MIKRALQIMLLLNALSGMAMAQVLKDPTRPPAEINEGSGVATHSVSTASTKGLLSVILSPTRCAAIIDGKTIKLGENYANSQLVEITTGGVVLQGAHGQRKMELFPRVGVKVTYAQPSTSPVICKLEGQTNQKQLPRQRGLKEKK